MQGAFFVVLLGFEPRFSEPESDVVPLHYKTKKNKTRMVFCNPLQKYNKNDLMEI